MWNTGLEEAQSGIKITGRNNLRFSDDSILMAESEELRSLLMKVREESEKIGLKHSEIGFQHSENEDHSIQSRHGK